jgi:GTPase involved in cell partitioning and DNA repair
MHLDEFHHEYVTIEATSSNLPHPNARKMPSAPPTTPESEFEQKFIQISRESKRMLREMAEKSEILISKFTKSHHILDLEKSAENDFSSAVQTSQIEIEHFAELLNNKLEMIVASESPELYPVEEWDDFLAEMSDFLKDKASVDAQQEKLWEKRENLLENQRKLMERQKYVYNKMMQIFNEAQKMGKIQSSASPAKNRVENSPFFRVESFPYFAVLW